MSILFYGDPHGQWQSLFEAVAQHRPDVVILLGDMGLDEPLRQKLAPVWSMVGQWRWIYGNHDADNKAYYDFLFGDYLQGSLHCRTDMLGGRIVGGLGGVFKSKVWSPRLEGDRDASSCNSAEDMIKRTARFDRWQGGLPLSQRDTIFPADAKKLRGLRADILVTHEGASSHPHGFVGIDDLAHAMGATLVVHGHLHKNYNGVTRDGIHVRGVGEATPWLLDESLLDGEQDPDL